MYIYTVKEKEREKEAFHHKVADLHIILHSLSRRTAPTMGVYMHTDMDTFYVGEVYPHPTKHTQRKGGRERQRG